MWSAGACAASSAATRRSAPVSASVGSAISRRSADSRGGDPATALGTAGITRSCRVVRSDVPAGGEAFWPSRGQSFGH